MALAERRPQLRPMSEERRRFQRDRATSLGQWRMSLQDKHFLLSPSWGSRLGKRLGSIPYPPPAPSRRKRTSGLGWPGTAVFKRQHGARQLGNALSRTVSWSVDTQAAGAPAGIGGGGSGGQEAGRASGHGKGGAGRSERRGRRQPLGGFLVGAPRPHGVLIGLGPIRALVRELRSFALPPASPRRPPRASR